MFELELKIVSGGRMEWGHTYRGDNIEEHDLTLRGENLTYDDLKNGVVALGIPMDNRDYNLEYMYPNHDSGRERAVLLDDNGFQIYLRWLDTLSRPLKLYHSRNLTDGQLRNYLRSLRSLRSE